MPTTRRLAKETYRWMATMMRNMRSLTDSSSLRALICTRTTTISMVSVSHIELTSPRNNKISYSHADMPSSPTPLSRYPSRQAVGFDSEVSTGYSNVEVNAAFKCNAKNQAILYPRSSSAYGSKTYGGSQKFRTSGKLAYFAFASCTDLNHAHTFP
jgi:hypothetical protein